jgi:hypothetical protein
VASRISPSASQRLDDHAVPSPPTTHGWRAASGSHVPHTNGNTELARSDRSGYGTSRRVSTKIPGSGFEGDHVAEPIGTVDLGACRSCRTPDRRSVSLSRRAALRNQPHRPSTKCVRASSLIRSSSAWTLQRIHAKPSALPPIHGEPLRIEKSNRWSNNASSRKAEHQMFSCSSDKFASRVCVVGP